MVWRLVMGFLPWEIVVTQLWVVGGLVSTTWAAARACGQIEHEPGNRNFALNFHQFGCDGPPLWIRRSGLRPADPVPVGTRRSAF